MKTPQLNPPDGLIESLCRNGFDPALPTYVIWEGNTMYLPLASDKAIMKELRDNLAAFRLSFDYLAKAVINFELRLSTSS